MTQTSRLASESFDTCFSTVLSDIMFERISKSDSRTLLGFILYDILSDVIANNTFSAKLGTRPGIYHYSSAPYTSHVLLCSVSKIDLYGHQDRLDYTLAPFYQLPSRISLDDRHKTLQSYFPPPNSRPYLQPIRSKHL